MKLEQQVCSLELAKQLKELGVKQESYFWWKEITDNFPHAEPWVFHTEVEVKDTKGCYKDNNQKPKPNGEWTEKHYAAFTVAELGEHIKKIGLRALQTQADVAVRGGYLFDTDYWATVLIYLIENNLLTPNTKE